MDEGSLMVSSSWLIGSAPFLQQLQPSNGTIGVPGALPDKLLIKEMDHRLAQGDIFSIEVSSSQMTQVDKVTPVLYRKAR